MKHAAYSQLGLMKWPLGSVSQHNISRHIKSVNDSFDRSVKRWDSMVKRLSEADNDISQKERIKIRAKELKRLSRYVEDAGKYKMLLYSYNCYHSFILRHEIIAYYSNFGM